MANDKLGTLTEQYRHTPVMLDEVIKHLCPGQDEVFLDCTLGGAGHSVQIAKLLGKHGILVGIDQDKMARQSAKHTLNTLSDETRPQIFVMDANFSDIDRVLSAIPVPGVDMVVFDLGVSSPQLDFVERGFTYKSGSFLDMRMDTDNNEITAAVILNEYEEAEIERILRVFGEEKCSKKIAHMIVEKRRESKIETSDDLVEIIKASIPAAMRRKGGHPAKRTFQALRIAVNRELEVLEDGLDAAIRWLNPEGRLCVISYHSLEDRIVKEKIRSLEMRCTCSEEIPICTCGRQPILKSRPRKAILPRSEEVETNPRSRSAKMRVAVKL